MKAREMVEKLDSDYVLYKGGTPIDLESIIKIYGAQIAKEQRNLCALAFYNENEGNSIQTIKNAPEPDL